MNKIEKTVAKEIVSLQKDALRTGILKYDGFSVEEINLLNRKFMVKNTGVSKCSAKDMKVEITRLEKEIISVQNKHFNGSDVKPVEHDLHKAKILLSGKEMDLGYAKDDLLKPKTVRVLKSEIKELANVIELITKELAKYYELANTIELAKKYYKSQVEFETNLKLEITWEYMRMNRKHSKEVEKIQGVLHKIQVKTIAKNMSKKDKLAMNIVDKVVSSLSGNSLNYGSTSLDI